ncbi:sugar kinase [Kitasatospora cinereorecta]|uniref:Sugar kinase n=1 Tax=Kitasatospora cinereorecta TaxID=285560 RepID=A0ABW0V4C1_9ACTN
MSSDGASTSGHTPAVVCLGESMAVLLPDPPGPFEAVDTFRVAFGGAESNVACGLAALGVTSAWVSRVGDDGLGRRLKAEIAAHGVDVSAVTTDPLRRTGLYLKETGTSSSRLHYYRAGSAASALGREVFDDPVFRQLLDGARILHLSGITPALSDSCLDLVHALLARRRPGLLISFDLNWRPALWLDRDPAVLPALLDAADLLFLGADEAETAFGTGDPAALRRMFPSPATIVVKDSGHRVTALAEDGTAVTEPALTVEVVEPTGAGDAFAAGYLAGTVRGLDRRSRLRLGHLSAAAALTTHGDHATPAPGPVINALLAASAADWAATRVTALGIDSPALPAVAAF